MPIPLPTALKVGGSVVSAIFGAKASSKRRKAARARKEITKITNFQQRRKFINDFITAQGQVLARGATSGIDIASSSTQGQLASQRTQATTGLIEQDRQRVLGEQAASLDQKANRLSATGALAGTLLAGAGEVAPYV